MMLDEIIYKVIDKRFYFGRTFKIYLNKSVKNSFLKNVNYHYLILYFMGFQFLTIIDFDSISLTQIGV